jgi:hypothetical protein
MALAPWLLVRLAREQPVAAPEPVVDPDQRTAGPDAARSPSSEQVDPSGGARRRPSTLALSALAGVSCLAIAAAMIISSQGGGRGPTPESVVGSHDAPELEALLPRSAAGRPLVTWSVRGEAVLRPWGLSAPEIDATRQQLASMGVRLDDLVQATAGRSDVQHDPPYFVLAFRIPADARDLLGGYAIASAGFARDTGDWQLEDRVVGGKTVEVGPPDLLVQSEHQRGRPYLYGSTALDTSFIVITDDEAWAEEAIRQLPS